MLDVCLLGTGGMMPLPNRWLASMLVRHNGKMILFDCGEGTQIPLRMAGWGFKAIDAICFTHYHADHISGLPGLLLTIGNSGREEPLTLIGPPGLEEVVKGLTVISPELPYELNLIEVSDTQQSALRINDIDLLSLPVDHAVPCLSYGIEVRRQGKFEAQRAKELKIPMNFWKNLQRGENVDLGHRVISPEMVLGEPRKGMKICYCTDSRPTEALIALIHESDLFVCEGMYGDDESLSKAIQKKHMTFSEAAVLAKEGKAEELWLTHYSPSVVDPQEHVENARRIFENSYAGQDLMTKTIKFKE